MKDSQRSDEKPPLAKRPGAAPIGTHSLTGDPADAGIPSPSPSPQASEAEDERKARDLPPGAEEPAAPQPRG